ncbi:conidial septation protein [Fusarium oxysporum]|nr:conidial septation protein [Fusarium oxysporum]
MSVLNNSLPSGRELVEVRRQLALQHAAARAFDSAVRRLPWLGGKHGQRVSENLANTDCFQEEYDNATPWAVALSNDAFEVHGDIRILFNQIGGEQGVGPGRWQSFQHGAMYWLPNLGAFALSTPINDKYNLLGGPLGSLGFPVHDEQPIKTAPGTFFKFQNGKTFWRSAPDSISVSMNSVYNFSID